MSTVPTFRLVDGAERSAVDLLGRTSRRAPELVAVFVRAPRPAGEGDGAVDDAAADSVDPAARVFPATRPIASALGVDLTRRLERASARGREGEVTDLQVQVADGDPGDAVRSLLVVGLGPSAASARAWRRAGAALARRTRGRDRVVVDVPRANPVAVRALVEGWGMASYSFTRKSKAPAAPARVVDLVVPRAGADLDEALRRALVTVDAVHLARELANTPSNEKTPAWLAARAERAVRDARVTVEVRDERELAAGGFGGILAVGAGSPRPPRLIELRYVPCGADSSTRHVVLVGKGITFDTGGLSLKPSDGMIAMKTDMAGGAAVIATLSALAALDVDVKVTGLVAAAENMPSGSAQRPGDVIEHYGGTTVEVFNTDAEGRLVLADALAYADRRLDPDVVVDLATLTGAASLGLGRRHAALFATDDRLARALERGAEDAGERLWRMPLVEDYRPALDSEVADLAHISRDRHVNGGAITAALFLREFVGDRPWAHLDIAGPGRSDAEVDEITKGATGWGTRTLLRWLEPR
jgi:leucyl aminopeptidase